MPVGPESELSLPCGTRAEDAVAEFLDVPAWMGCRKLVSPDILIRRFRRFFAGDKKAGKDALGPV